ncbi:unnamed protein product [Discosporangium mesarthrocarpum]
MFCLGCQIQYLCLLNHLSKMASLTRFWQVGLTLSALFVSSYGCASSGDTCGKHVDCCKNSVCMSGTCQRPPVCSPDTIDWSENRVTLQGSECRVHLRHIRDKTDGVAASIERGVWKIWSTILLRSPSVLLELHGLKVHLLSSQGESVYIEANPGKISISNSTITSYDPATKKPDKRETGRAYIAALSSEDGGESRMDVYLSEISYLGNDGDYHNDIEDDFGLVWKVKGFDDRDYKEVDLELFEKVGVYGNLRKSHLHHNAMGAYCYGMKGEAVWAKNNVHNNMWVGLNPQDNSDDMTLRKNKVHDNGWHGIEISKRCLNAVVYENKVVDNGRVGIFFHRSSNHGKAFDNFCGGNAEGDMGIFESTGIEIYDNEMIGGRYGIRLSLGAQENHIHDNVMENNTRYGVFMYKGSDEPEASRDYNGRPRNNLFEKNTIKSPKEGQGMAIKESDGDEILNNVFKGIDSMRFDDSTDTLVKKNDFDKGVEFKLENGATLRPGSQTGTD